MTLEHDLRALAEGFPDPPPLAPRVLAAAQRATAIRRRRRRIALVALALVLLVPATALAVSSDLRDRVLETFGLRDVRITSVTRLPEVGPDARRLQLGASISLARARRDLKLAVRPPSALGAPDGIFEDRLESGVDVTFLYERSSVERRLGVRKRVIVSILRGKIQKTILGKTVPPATRTIALEIEGGAALLLTGHPHLLVMFRAPGGGLDQTYTRLVGTTLVWQRGGLLVRIEGSLPQARLVAIARSIGFG
jgi:hypothetical protein